MKGNYGKRFLSMMLTVIMVMGMLPVNAFATDDLPEGITIINDCTHHQHDAACGYVEAVDGVDCAHTHDATCGYAEAVEEVSCDCTDANEDGVVDHAEDCPSITPPGGGVPGAPMCMTKPAAMQKP